MAVREQLSGSRSSPPIYSHFRSRFWICPQIQLRMWEFLCQEQWWEKFPHSQLDLGANPESAPEMAINSLPLAHILSCSLTAMVITSHMNGKQSGESQVPGNRVIKQLIRVELGKSSSAPMSTHLKGVAVKRATSHLSQFCSFWL